MAPGSRQLIVNADDLGRTSGINGGIFSAHRQGIVSSATLMVGFPTAVEAALELERYPDLGIGLHVTLTGATPLLPAESVSSLVDHDGRFPAKPEGHDAPDPDEVRAEVKAQLERFEKLMGRLPTHLDSHHHSHRLPLVCDVLVQFAAELRIPLRNASADVETRIRAAGVETTDRFVEEFFGKTATTETLIKVIDELPEGSTELMCHPARIDLELRQSSSYVDDRVRELEVLTDPAMKAHLERRGIELTHFGAL